MFDGWAFLHTNDRGDTIDEAGRIVNEDGTEPHGVVIEIDSPPQPITCDVCGAELLWVDCWMCDGDGEYDETETDPLEGDPLATCPECHGEGGYLECAELPHHTDDEP